MRRNTAERIRSSISHVQQWQTHLHCATLQFSAKPNRPTHLRDCKFRIADTDENTRRELLKEAIETAERNANRRWNQPTRQNGLPGTSCTRPSKRKEDDEPVSNTVAAVLYKENESREDQMDGCKEIKTVDESVPDTC